MNKYHRQEILIGSAGQQKIEQATVTIIGIGALGTVVAELLTRAGVGNIILIDRDVIEETNLHRQSLFTPNNIGQLKALVAKEKLQEINPQPTIAAHTIHLDQSNIDTCQGILIDCTDNIQTRLLLNDYVKKNDLSLIHAAAIKHHGNVFIVKDQACLQCFLQPASLETCETAGVLNTTTHLVATLQADLTIKTILNKPTPGELIRINLEHHTQEKLTVKRNPKCLACKGEFTHLNQPTNHTTIQFCGNNRYQITGQPIQLNEISQKLNKPVSNNTIQTQDYILFPDGRALIHAESAQQAQSIYSKLIGN